MYKIEHTRTQKSLAHSEEVAQLQVHPVQFVLDDSSFVI